MYEQYDEYRGSSRDRRERREHRRSGSTHGSGTQGAYSKRFLRQLTVSVLCFSAVYSLKATNTGFGTEINGCIKSALTYKMNSDRISGTIRDILKKTGIEPKKNQNGEAANEQNVQNEPDSTNGQNGQNGQNEPGSTNGQNGQNVQAGQSGQNQAAPVTQDL